MVIAKEMADGSQATSYEHGFPVGFKASYAGEVFQIRAWMVKHWSEHWLSIEVLNNCSWDMAYQGYMFLCWCLQRQGSHNLLINNNWYWRNFLEYVWIPWYLWY